METGVTLFLEEKFQRGLGAATGCQRGPQYDGKCSFYLNCYFFRTSPTNRDLTEKAVYFPPRPGSYCSDITVAVTSPLLHCGWV